MRGYHPEEIANMNNEELDNLISCLQEEKQSRKELEKYTAITALRVAFDNLYNLGIEAWYRDEMISFEDLHIED